MSAANVVAISARRMPSESRNREVQRVLDMIEDATTRMRVCDLNAHEALVGIHAIADHQRRWRRLSDRGNRYRRFIRLCTAYAYGLLAEAM